MTFGQLIFVLTGLLFVAVAVPLVRRRIKPNPWYGLRVPATLADEHVWYEVNARSGRDLIGLGVAIVVLAVVLPRVLDVTAEVFIGIMVAFTLVGAIGLAAWNWTHANRMWRDRRAR